MVALCVGCTPGCRQGQRWVLQVSTRGRAEGAHLPSKGPCLPFHMTASARGCWVPCTSPVSLTDRPDGEEAFGSLSW